MEAIGLVRGRLGEDRCYRLIFMDVNMPKMGGVETVRAIRQICKECEEQPFIVGVTGDSDPATEEMCRAGGMDRVGKTRDDIIMR